MYTLMGPGCEKVSRAATAESDEIVGVWKDGRIGTVRAMRPQGEYGAVDRAKDGYPEHTQDSF